MFSIGTILCYGTAQQFSKRGVQLIGSYQTGIIYAIASVTIQTGYWLALPDDVQGDIGGILIAIFAGIVGGLGFVFYLFALKIGKVSIVSVITAGYPAVAVLLAIVLLDERLTSAEAFGVSLVILAIIALSLPEGLGRRDSGEKKSGERRSLRWLFWAVMAFVFWGIWAVPSKVAIESIGESDYIFIDSLTMVLIWVPLWLFMEKGRLDRNIRKLSYSATAGTLASIGTVCLFLGIANGQVSIVTPVTSIYPIFTVILARLMLKERLRWLQYLAIVCGVSGTVLLAA